METVQVAIPLLTEEIKFINQQLAADIREMTCTTIKPWIAELLYMEITEAQPAVHHPQKHPYKKDLTFRPTYTF